MHNNLKTIFDEKSWAGKGNSPRSGHGSSLEATLTLRTALPDVLKRYDVTRLVDAPCGDWTWMQTVDLTGISYLGADIAPSLIDDNRDRHKRSGVDFEVLDITSDPLPKSDLFICRECLFHLKFWLRWKFFENFANSDGRYLMTTIDHIKNNRRLAANGDFSPFDPRLAPYNLPEPIEILPERFDFVPPPAGQPNEQKQRSMGIWSIEQIQGVVSARQEASNA